MYAAPPRPHAPFGWLRSSPAQHCRLPVRLPPCRIALVAADNTYDNFLRKNEDILKMMPVPAVARKYYVEDNPYMFDSFCTVKDPEGSVFSNGRPELETLYDVFVNVRNDEREHWKTLCNLVQYDDMQGFGEAIAPTQPMPSLSPSTTSP